MLRMQKKQVPNCKKCKQYKVEIAVQKMHLNWVQWSTAYSGWLQKLPWNCSGNSNTVETCKICREIIYSLGNGITMGGCPT